MLEKHALHPSLYRPVVYAGVAPAFLFVEVCAAFLLLFEAGVHVVTVGLALFYVLVFHPVALALCARDPMIAELYVRSLRGADLYVAAPGFAARVPPVDPALPGRV
jgi:type IV secretory pathway VirB3-like protein